MPSYPKTVAEAVNILVGTIPESMEITIRSMPSPDDMNSLHFSLGVHIRNNFGLNDGNSELIDDACPAQLFATADTASSAIMDALWRRLNGV